MKNAFIAALTLFTTLATADTALAHGGEHARDINLHEGYDYATCYFDLHPELTKKEFKTFAAESGQVIYFRPVASADTLGQWNFDVGLTINYSIIDDTKGAWNNTMTHPGDEHYLGEALLIPQLTLRMGVTDDIDIELYGTTNPGGSNYGFVGAAAKVRILNQHAGWPVSVAVRPNVSGLVGPKETSVWNFGTDVLVSYNFHGFAPFAGVGLNTALAVDKSDDTDVGNQAAFRPVPMAGVDYNWKHLSLGAQAEYSTLASFSARVGVRF